MKGGKGVMTNQIQNNQNENQLSQNEFTIEEVEKSSSNKVHHAIEVALDVAENLVFGSVSIYSMLCCTEAIKSLSMPISIGLMVPWTILLNFTLKCGDNIISIMNKTYYNQDEQQEKTKKKVK